MDKIRKKLCHIVILKSFWKHLLALGLDGKILITFMPSFLLNGHITAMISNTMARSILPNYSCNCTPNNHLCVSDHDILAFVVLSCYFGACIFNSSSWIVFHMRNTQFVSLKPMQLLSGDRILNHLASNWCRAYKKYSSSVTYSNISLHIVVSKM